MAVKKQVKRKATHTKTGAVKKTAQAKAAPKKSIADEVIAGIDNVSSELDNGAAKLAAKLDELIAWQKRSSDTLERIEQNLARSADGIMEAVEKEISMMEKTFDEGVRQGRASARPALVESLPTDDMGREVEAVDVAKAVERLTLGSPAAELPSLASVPDAPPSNGVVTY